MSSKAISRKSSVKTKKTFGYGSSNKNNDSSEIDDESFESQGDDEKTLKGDIKKFIHK